MLIRAIMIAAFLLIPAISLADPPESFPEGSSHFVCKGPDALKTLAAGAILGGTDGIADAFDDVPCVAGKMKTSFLTLDAQWLGQASLQGLAMELWSVEIESTLSGARIWLLWIEPASAIEQGTKQLET